MKIPKKVVDATMAVVGISEKFLIGAGISALIAKTFDEEGFDGVIKNWSPKTKNTYAVTVGVVTMIVIFADSFRETILNDSYNYACSDEEEIDVVL